jgi:Raf kinase inhibitor-like YbhB/YbcL family protein
MPLSLRSPAFGNHEPIPERYSCDGDDVSPPLAWSGVPAKAKSLALIVHDPHAREPEQPEQTYVHWVLYDIPASATGLPERASGRELPLGTREGLNDLKRPEYRGPCPEAGRHHYIFKLYATDKVFDDISNPTKERVEAALRGHILEHAELVGTYERQAVRIPRSHRT